MKKELRMVQDFHTKFRAGLSDTPTLLNAERSAFRHFLMSDEVREYLDGANAADLPNIAKELSDILYAVYGTIIEHGLQNVIEDVFAEVHRSNMSKEYHPEKMVKGEEYSPADVKQFFPE